MARRRRGCRAQKEPIIAVLFEASSGSPSSSESDKRALFDVLAVGHHQLLRAFADFGNDDVICHGTAVRRLAIELYRHDVSESHGVYAHLPVADEVREQLAATRLVESRRFVGELSALQQCDPREADLLEHARRLNHLVLRHVSRETRALQEVLGIVEHTEAIMKVDETVAASAARGPVRLHRHVLEQQLFGS